MTGTLYICGTPIGNLEDITIRALKTLQEVDVIASEDTRRTIKLLNHFEIKTPLTSYHEHNKFTKGLKIIDMLNNGKNIALVSDAGMPGISDPGEDLVKLCYQNNIKVTTVPGATALISGLVLSGLDTRKFTFEGFLSSNKNTRRNSLSLLTSETKTIILYEAPHHLKKTLKDIYSILGERNITIVREITKKFEEVNATTIQQAIEYYTNNDPRGEYVLVIQGASPSDIKNELISTWDSYTIEEHYSLYLKKGLDNKSAMKCVAKDRGIGKRDVYTMLLKQDS
jgi:16S rRNA (cytidine1402-2'-O)-methyltransferase